MQIHPTPAERLRTWSLRLPHGWNMDHVELHATLLVALPALALSLTLLSILYPGWTELRTAAVSLPLVILASLAVRTAAQQLALGGHAGRFETIIGPVGNHSNDYERLEGPIMFSYAVAGQIATASLVILGFIVSAATEPAMQASPTLAGLFDFRCGWSSRALASQILWANLFLCVLHLLPTWPFDMRAMLFACCKIRRRNVDQAAIHHFLHAVHTHLSAFVWGIAVAGFALEWMLPTFFTGWYSFAAVGVYLMVASRWEYLHTLELDAQFIAAEAVPTLRRDTAHARKPDSSHRKTVEFPRVREPVVAEFTPYESTPADVDDILRKLHREGHAALSASEKEALLSASRKLKEKRGQR